MLRSMLGSWLGSHDSRNNSRRNSLDSSGADHAHLHKRVGVAVCFPQVFVKRHANDFFFWKRKVVNIFRAT